MSARTWLKEFYPVEAVTFSGKRRTKKNLLAALDHSDRKWDGMRSRNLSRHKVILFSYELWEGDKVFLSICGGSCALCQIVGREKSKDSGFEHFFCCNRCPVFKVRGGVPCDELRPREKMAPYHQLNHGDGPARMLYWLKRARKMVGEKDV